MSLIIINIIIMCQICCRHRRSRTILRAAIHETELGDHTLCRQFSYELIVWTFLSCYRYEVIVCVLCALSSPALGTTNFSISFSSASALFIRPKNCSCLFVMVLSRIFFVFPLLIRLTSFQSKIFS